MKLRPDGRDLGSAVPRGDFLFRGSSSQEQTPSQLISRAFRNVPGSPSAAGA